MQENVSVVIGQNSRQLGGEINWKLAKQLLLLFKRDGHQQARGIGGVERTQHAQGLFPPLLGDHRTQLFRQRSGHWSKPTAYYSCVTELLCGLGKERSQSLSAGSSRQPATVDYQDGAVH